MLYLMYHLLLNFLKYKYDSDEIKSLKYNY